MSKLHAPLTWAIYCAYAALAVLSNRNDWDHFLSFFEVDLRSWLVHGEAPLWTYQLCAGSSRLGDPQAFGLSPLFLPVLALGSLWGSKALAVLCAVLGHIYLTRILSLLAPEAGKHGVSSALACFFVFGNFFLWHLNAGHLTFSLILFSFVPAYYLLLGFLKGLPLREAPLLVLSLFSYCTAGFYHSLVFFVFPILLFAMLFLLLHLPSAHKKLFAKVKPSRALLPLAFALLAVALSAFKWLGVLKYQALFPRTLTTEPDLNPLLAVLTRFLVPTFQYNYLGAWADPGNWAVFEYSAFSLLPYALLALAGFSLTQKPRKQALRAWESAGGWRACLCLLAAFLICMGDSSIFPLHTLLNENGLRNSIRVPTRFSGVVLLLLTLFLAQFLNQNPAARKFFRKLLPFGLALTLVNILSFLSLTPPHEVLALAKTPVIVSAEMSDLIPAKQRTLEIPGDSFMYPPVMLGALVPNCYQPLKRETKIGHERWRSPVLPPLDQGKLSLLAPGAEKVPEECKASAFVTQNSLSFDEQACPQDLCFHLNMVNIHEASKLVWNEKRGLYCRR